MESGQGSGSNTDLKTHASTMSGEVEQSEKGLVGCESFVSTSSSDNLEDTFEINGNEINTERATQSPPKQVMERPRIPAGVFETNKSGQMEWSTASAESLFSIQMGNMSFNTDALLLAGKSVDLAERKAQEAARKSNMSVGPTEAAAAQTMKEVIRENEERTSKQLHSHPQHYNDSAVSIQSFAFDPVLTTEGAHSKGKHNKAAMPTTPNSEQQTPKITETPKQQNPKTKKKWLSFLPCCN